jgi:hypothetical protein
VMAHPVDPFARDAPMPPRKGDEYVFYKHRVSGITLRSSPSTILDQRAVEGLARWFLEHGYSDDELERRTIEVLYRVLPRHEEWYQ